MDQFSKWLLTAFRKRMDELDKRIQAEPHHHGLVEGASTSFDRLKKTLNEEQLQRFIVWEEQASQILAEEKEKLYLHGFLDGIRVYANILELDAGNRPGTTSPSSMETSSSDDAEQGDL